MVFVPDDRTKQKMAKNGSVLQFMHSVAGAGKGLITMGAMLLVIGAMLAAALFGTMGAEGAGKLAAVIAVPSILLIVLGIFMQQKRAKEWVAAYEKRTSLKESDLHQIDKEFQDPKTVLFSLDKGKDTNSLKKMGFITTNYIKFPGVKPCIYRLDDVVACFYTKKLLCADGGYNRALIAYSVEGDWGFYWESPPEEASLEIVKVVGEHNPKIITDHHFVYEGREYDAANGVDDVIALHKRVYGR